MTLEKWYDYPKAYDIVKDSVFFDELKENLISVIYDYAGLGVEDEAEIAYQASQLFLDKIVPSKKDWKNLEEILDILSQYKEFRPIWNELFQSAKPTLNIEDLVRIREFLDQIQRMGPIIEGIHLEMPVPNITKLTKPNVGTTNNYQSSLTVSWDIDPNSLRLKTGRIVGFPALNEDVTGYKISIEAGTYHETRDITPYATEIEHEVSLDWWAWFGSNIRQASLLATLEAIDKRGNIGQQAERHSYLSDVKMQAPIISYEVQYKIDSNNWVALTTTSNKSYLWTNLPKQTGSYRFRVRGLDQISQYTDWVESDPVWMQYIDYTLAAPRVSGVPTTSSIAASWTHVDKATHYDIWIGDDENTAKSQHSGTRTRWVTQIATATRRVTFNGLSSGTRYKISVRARNHQHSAIGYTHVTTLRPVVIQPEVTKQYLPIGNQVYNWGYTMLWGNYAPSNTYYGPHWHNGGIGDSTGCYQGEWVDGEWTGLNQWNYQGQKLRGGGPETYWAWHGQHWGNRMSFVHYDYAKMKQDMRGKTIKRVTISGTRRSSYHGHHSAHPMYLYNHKRDYTGSIGTSSSGGGTTTTGAKYYTVKSGDYLNKIASAHGITLNQLKTWNNLTSNLIHPGDKLQVSQGRTTTTGGGGVSDNSLVLYRADNRARLGNSNQSSAYNVNINQGNNFSFNNSTTRNLVHNIANGDMKGIGMAILYGSNYTTRAGYYSQDLAYMSFTKGSFALNVTYQ